MDVRLLQKVYSRTVRIVAGICTATVFGFHTLPHVFPQKTLQVAQQIQTSQKLSDKHHFLVQDACKRLGVDPNRIEVYYTNGFGAHSAGCCNLPNKAVIGLPKNALYTCDEDVLKDRIHFNHRPIDWNSNVGKALQEVLVLSEDQLKFLIGHELTHIKNLDFTLTTAHSTICCYGFYKAGITIPNLLRGSRSLGHIVLWNIFIWGCGVTFYLYSRSVLAHYLEHKADYNSSRLGIDYCAGGISYMRNRLKLNRVLRKLFRVDGEEMYSKVGNNLKDVATHPKRTTRLAKLKEVLKEYEDVNN